MFRFKTFIIGLMLTLCFSSIFFIYMNLRSTLFERFEVNTLDLRYKARGEIKKDFDVVIVGIDEKSLNKIGKWPWKREIHGRLVDKLNEYEVKSIGFDVSFNKSSTPQELKDFKKKFKSSILSFYKEKKLDKKVAFSLATQLKDLNVTDDEKFAEYLKKNPNVTIGTYNILEEEDSGVSDNVKNNTVYLKSRYINVVGFEKELTEVGRTGKRTYKPFSVYKILPSLAMLSKYCYGVAPFEIGTPDIDGKFRSIPMATYEEYSGLYFPPLFLLVFLNAFDMTIENNVVLNLNEEGIEIYKDAQNFEGLLLKIPTDKNGYRFLNYYGDTETFKYVPYIDVLEGKIEKDVLKDKIILVGYTDTAKGLYDLRPTPFGPNTPGVEIHATAIQNLIDKKFLFRLGLLPNLLFILGFGMLFTTILSLKKMKFITTNITVFVLFGLYIFTVQYLFANNYWVDFFYPLFSFSLIYGSLTVFNYFGEELEKSKIKNAFKHYTSPDLIEELMKNPDMLKLGGERKELTAFFSDIEGFTTISENMEPEELVDYINAYLSAMTDIILKFKGMVDKYEGDAIMAIFGAPIYMGDHAVNCCYAALEYQKVLEKFRNDFVDKGMRPIYARIGINTGDMIAGNMGSQERFDYTVIGDEVNLAARLEQANKEFGTYTMLSKSTYLRTKDLFEFRELGDIKVKGKEKVITVFELLSEKGCINKDEMLFREKFEEGLKNYREGKFNIAKEFFTKAFDLKKEDFASNEYIKKCEYLMNNLPEDTWDIIYTFEMK